MHILFESHGLNEFGESETYKAYKIIAAAAEYARVSVVLPERWVSQVPSLELMGATVIPVAYDSTQFPFSPEVEYPYPLFARRAAAAVRSLLPEVDVVHRLNPNAVRFCSTIAFEDAPFVIGPLGWSSLPPAWTRHLSGAARNVLKSVDRARIRSRFTRLHEMYVRAHAIALVNEAALEAFPPVLRSKCTTTYEWIDTNAHTELPTPDNDVPVILFVGRLIPYKGVEYLLQALSRMTDVPWVFRLVGDGPLADELKQMTVALGLGGRVDFVGRVPREAVADYYREADICCFPGLNESSGNVNVEAMSCGRPVVVADWAGPREIVTVDCGVRVPVDSPEVLTNGLEAALRDLVCAPDRRVAMGKAGRRRAVEVYDVEVAMRKFKSLHDSAAHSRRSRATGS